MRLALALLAALLALSIVSPVKWLCGRDAAFGQLPLTPRELTQYDFVQAAYAKQIERIWSVFYEGYLTRPDHKEEEDEKFRRAIRTARIARERAMEMIFKEPWAVVTPLGQKPGVPPGRPAP